jgi:hypothetical protein
VSWTLRLGVTQRRKKKVKLLEEHARSITWLMESKLWRKNKEPYVLDNGHASCPISIVGISWRSCPHQFIIAYDMHKGFSSTPRKLSGAVTRQKIQGLPAHTCRQELHTQGSPIADSPYCHFIDYIRCIDNFRLKRCTPRRSITSTSSIATLIH